MWQDLYCSSKSVFMQGCPCHRIHIAAQNAAEKLAIKIDELLIDIYYYLDKSSSRQVELQKCQELCNSEERKILKHVNTRWLSQGTCVNRLLRQWEPLQMMFGIKENDSLFHDAGISKVINVPIPAVPAVHVMPATSKQTTIADRLKNFAV